jgi:CHAD domain-containing protein
MSTASTPATLLNKQLQIVRILLPGLRDGDAGSIHDARVATRRLRELLRFANGQIGDDLRERFRFMGRALGRVRDADVALALLQSLETRLPHASPALVPFRYAESQARLRLMRNLIKRLERMHIERLVSDLAIGSRRHASGFGSGWGNWKTALGCLITTRAELAAEALDHATGVYFPNRMHAARVALKKLRYAMEVANDMRAVNLAVPLRDLKKTQDVLGDLHDRQALLDHLPGDPDGTATTVAEVRQLIDAEINGLHQRYLSRRHRLTEIARDAQTLRLAHPWRLPSLAIAGALALSSGAYAAQRRLVAP